MNKDLLTYACGNCGFVFRARPITCECGARFAGDESENLIVLESQTKPGQIGFAASLVVGNRSDDDG